MDSFKEVITIIITSVAIPFFAYIGTLFASWLKTKLNTEKHSGLWDATKKLYLAADSLFLGENQGDKKFQYVSNRLSSKFNWASARTIKESIEAFHTSFNNEIKK
jgi:hypothetical protein